MANWFRRLVGGTVQDSERARRPRRFSRDRSRLFDLDQTARLVTLLEQPADARDDQWRQAFHLAAWYASLEAPSAQSFLGPDGFPYLRFDVPRPGAFESQSLGNLAAALVGDSVGAALFASPDAPTEAAAHVFSMGVLDGLIRFDDPAGDPLDRAGPPTDRRVYAVEQLEIAQQLTLRHDHQAMVGTPTADYLPPSTARPLHRHLVEQWGMTDPGVCLLLDPALSPARTLVIGRKRGDFPAGAPVDAMAQRLMWYLPPGRMIALMPDEWSADELTPLSRYL